VDSAILDGAESIQNRRTHPPTSICATINGMTTRTAQGACGRLRVTVPGEPIFVGVCHCDFCQKRTGSVFQVGAYYPKDQHVEISGEVKSYNGLEVNGVGPVGGGSATYYFCPTCGSTVYWHGSRFLAVAVGNFVDPDFPAPTTEMHTRMRHRWVPPVPGAARFEEFPPDL